MPSKIREQTKEEIEEMYSHMKTYDLYKGRYVQILIREENLYVATH